MKNSVYKSSSTSSLSYKSVRRTKKQLTHVKVFFRHVLSDGRLVVGARRSLVDAGGGGSSAVLRCKASNRAGVTLSRPMLLQPGMLIF